MVAQVIDAVTATRLNRGPDESSPKEAAVPPLVRRLGIAAILGDSRAADNRRGRACDMSGKRGGLPRVALEAGMRHCRHALLLFGAGSLLGLAVVSAGWPWLGRVASLTMAAGLVLLPVALIADWRRRTPQPKAKRKSKKRRTAPKRPQPRKRR